MEDLGGMSSIVVVHPEKRDRALLDLSCRVRDTGVEIERHFG